MKGFNKKIISIVLSFALVVAGMQFPPTPHTVLAADNISGTGWKAEITANTTTTYADDIWDNCVHYYNYVRYDDVAIAGFSGEDTGDHCLAAYAIDNNSSTRWADKNSADSGYITVNLGAIYPVSHIFVNWEVANAKVYKIQYSQNGSNFSDAVTISSSGTELSYGGNRSDKIVLDHELKAQYIRIQVTERCAKSSSDSGNYGGCSIREIGIYGTSREMVGIDWTGGYSGFWTNAESNDGWKTVFADTDSDSGATYYNYTSYNQYHTVSASADAYSNSLTPDKALDGNVDNGYRWAAESRDDGHWLTINLGAEYHIKKVNISWEVAQSSIYNIETSCDGIHFDTAATVNADCWNKNKVDKITLQNTVKAQYVRIYNISRANGYGSSIWEIGIYGPDSETEAEPYSLNAFPTWTNSNANHTSSYGNNIEAENWAEDLSAGVKGTANNSDSLGETQATGRAGYRIYFDRKSSSMTFRWSAKTETAAGKLYVWQDEIGGTPIATLVTEGTSASDWNTYRETTIDNVEVSQGDHKIYFTFEPDTDGGRRLVCNVDWFRFNYAPETAVGVTHEAEDAHAFTVGANNRLHTVVSNDTFSGNAAIGEMNTSNLLNPAYLTTYVDVDTTSLYTLKAVYASEAATTLAYRVDNGTWNRVSLNNSGSWYNTYLAVAPVDIELSEGIHKIDVTGSVDDSWINLDYFTLESTTYSQNAFTARSTSTTGNVIEAEEFVAGTVWTDTGTDNGQSGTGNIGATKNGTWAQYNIHFDRKTSGIVLRRSANDNAQGNILIWVDSMAGTPVASIYTTAGSGWGSYSNLTGNVVIPQGDHKIFLQFIPDDGKSFVANIDYFTFLYTPEELDDDHEAENAHTFTQGSAENVAQIISGSFSNGSAVSNMNTYAANTLSYMTTYVNVDKPGRYKMIIGYALAGSTTPQISYRVNGTKDSQWVSVEAAPTGGNDTVAELITNEIVLKKGVNIIDISGARNASNVSFANANIDYFKFETVRLHDLTNLAYGKPTTSGTVQSDEDNAYAADSAVDEETNTRWISNSSSDNWFTVDLEGLYEIEEIDILFERAYGSDFKILFSRDNSTWVTARSVKNFNNAAYTSEDSIEWNSKTTEGSGNPNYGCLGKARYIKLNITNCSYNQGGVNRYAKASVWEFVVRGTAVPDDISNVAAYKSVSVSSKKDDLIARNATDGNYGTRWGSSTSLDKQWYEINLRTRHKLYSVDLSFERNYAKNFTVQISNDGENWTTVHTKANWEESLKADLNDGSEKLGYSFHFDTPVEATYVRFEATDARSNNWGGVSIWEFEVWGKELTKADYWSSIKSSDYGIYEVDGLYSLSTAEDGRSIGDIELVQSDVIANNDTYEMVYEPGKDIFFYINPYSYNINMSTNTLCWSQADSGTQAWGAAYNTEIMTYVTQTDATVKYKLSDDIDFGDADYVTTEIACQIWNTSDMTDGEPNSGKTPQRNIKFTLKILKSHDIYIDDTIRTNGCLAVRSPQSGATYEWQKSSDGSSWQNVSEKRYDLTIVGTSGRTINVAMDLGGGKYYRVRKSGEELWSQPYLVPYFNNVQNGDFESPAMYRKSDSGAIFPFNNNGDEQQYPNGYPGMVWKTTGPGWQTNSRVGHDIEIVNGRYLLDNSTWGFSVSKSQMYNNEDHGDQFAELNCENVGALYQDILTTPGSECYWDLDHAARWTQNTMYVVAMSSTDAQACMTTSQITKIVTEAQKLGLDDTGASDYSAQTEITLDGSTKAYVWKVESPEQAGVWAHHSGMYTVPQGERNYLTRFFFVSERGSVNNGSEDATVGNLLDNVTFEMKQSYQIEYYINGTKIDAATVSGISTPYSRIAIPSTISGYDLSDYSLVNAQIGGTTEESFAPYYVDESDRNMTIAYNHNNLKLYYENGTVAITKKIVGISKVPSDYTFTFKVESTDGATTYFSQKVYGSQFTQIDKVNQNDPDSCFVAINYSTTELTSGTQYKITEIVSNPAIYQGGQLKNYLTQANANGTVSNLSLLDLNDAEKTYSGTFTYSSGANTVSMINTYASTRKVTVTKKVTGNMGDKYKDFHFTAHITKNGSAIDAVETDSDTALTHATTGSYQMDLRHGETTEFLLYEGSNITVTEDDYSSQYYDTSWSIRSASANTSSVENSRIVSLEGVANDFDMICINDNNDIGDVEVQGFQMNTNTAVGGASEYNPSFRIVCRVSNNTIKRKRVVKSGVIYGMADHLDSSRLNRILRCNVPDEYSEYVQIHETTENGYYDSWTTQDEFSEKNWNYYALTFIGTHYVYGALEQNWAVRAYAELEDGSIEYGSNIYTFNMYQIADNLYQNQKMSTEEGHNFIYTNILNLVTMNNNRRNIGTAIMNTLGASNKDKTTDEYKLANGAYKDILYYVYCENGYEYSGRGDFSPISIDATTLLEQLKAKSADTVSASVSEWIYNNTSYFYKKVPYAWDNGIYKKAANTDS